MGYISSDRDKSGIRGPLKKSLCAYDTPQCTAKRELEGEGTMRGKYEGWKEYM
jgi:hypothetical protein